MCGIAGNLPDFEEATRTLYAKDQGRFCELIDNWPKNIKNHLKRLISEAVKLEEKAAEES